MNTSNIKINTQSSIRIEFDKILYFDPFKIELNDNDADIIFITHEHYDQLIRLKKIIQLLWHLNL